jgi:hypothetical protein
VRRGPRAATSSRSAIATVAPLTSARSYRICRCPRIAPGRTRCTGDSRHRLSRGAEGPVGLPESPPRALPPGARQTDGAGFGPTGALHPVGSTYGACVEASPEARDPARQRTAPGVPSRARSPQHDQLRVAASRTRCGASTTGPTGSATISRRGAGTAAGGGKRHVAVRAGHRGAPPGARPAHRRGAREGDAAGARPPHAAGTDGSLHGRNSTRACATAAFVGDARRGTDRRPATRSSGSWVREQPAGAFRPFLNGFLVEDGHATFGRPTGLGVARDGALLVGDDTTGVIYRVSYTP